MGLEETVIVRPEQVADLYVAENAERYYSVLRYMGLLPLTVKGLTTEKGNALLHLATWVYFSGDISHRNFTPQMHGHKSFLDYLVKEYLGRLGKFRTKERPENRGTIFLANNSGAIGRLIHAMGVPRPQRVSGSMVTKPTYGRSLPHYFSDIVNTTPRDDTERKERRDLLYTISRILFKDRLTIEPQSRNRSQIVYINLNSFRSEESARQYALDLIHFLKCIFPTQSRNGLFGEDSIRVYWNSSGQIYYSKLRLNQHQLGHLATRSPPILDVQVRY